MKLHLSHKIEIKPNNIQRTFLLKSCGVSRIGYNSALFLWKTEYEAGNKPNMYSIKKQINDLKKEKFPWSYEVSKCCIEESIIDLGKAFNNFFKVKTTKYPKFKKKGINDSFRLNNLNFKVLGEKLKIAKLSSPLKLCETLRFKGKVLSCTISRQANKWFASINIELDWDESIYKKQKPSFLGIDLGINHLAFLSNGEVFDGPKSYKGNLKKLKRISRSFSRKVKGSSNWKKQKIKLSKLHHTISNIRKDFLDKLSTYICKSFSVITLEDLNVSGMLKNSKLARAIQDMGFYRFRSMLEYKAKLYDSTIVIADRFFPSSKLCSSCGSKKDELSLATRVYNCSSCGSILDRDLNASLNLKNYGIEQITAVGLTL